MQELMDAIKQVDGPNSSASRLPLWVSLGYAAVALSIVMGTVLSQPRDFYPFVDTSQKCGPCECSSDMVLTGCRTAVFLQPVMLDLSGL
jgi:hypothetical protein